MVWAAKTSEAKCVEHDFVWVCGFDVSKSKQRRAWRKLVDNMGADVIAKEFASHCDPACGGVGLVAAKSSMAQALRYLACSTSCLSSARRRPRVAS